jgi:hypothetical protein
MKSKLAEMRDTVLSELARIPNWPSQQSALRMAYWPLRMKSLGKKAEKKDQTAYEVLLDCIAEVQKYHPGYEFLYDKAFFRKA